MKKKYGMMLALLSFLAVNNIQAKDYYTAISMGATPEIIEKRIDYKDEITFRRNSDAKLEKNDLIGTGTTIAYKNLKDSIVILTAVIPGDVTGDGEVKINDVSAIYGHVKNGETLVYEYFAAADTDNSNNVSINDVAAVYKLVKSDSKYITKYITLKSNGGNSENVDVPVQSDANGLGKITPPSKTRSIDLIIDKEIMKGTTANKIDVQLDIEGWYTEPVGGTKVATGGEAPTFEKNIKDYTDAEGKWIGKDAALYAHYASKTVNVTLPTITVSDSEKYECKWYNPNQGTEYSSGTINILVESDYNAKYYVNNASNEKEEKIVTNPRIDSVCREKKTDDNLNVGCMYSYLDNKACKSCPDGYTSDGGEGIGSCYIEVPVGYGIAAKSNNYTKCEEGYYSNGGKITWGNKLDCVKK